MEFELFHRNGILKGSHSFKIHTFMDSQRVDVLKFFLRNTINSTKSYRMLTIKVL